VWDRDRAVEFLNETCRTLRTQTDLSPANPVVTETLHGLVTTLSAWRRAGFGADLPDDPGLAEARIGLPALCAAAECEMEKWWGRRILASDGPWRLLTSFWYLPNYQSLRAAEAGLAGAANLRRAVIFGCGALPLTAILLAGNDPEARLRCVDADGEACTLADGVIRALNLAGRIDIVHGDAEAVGAAPEETALCASLLRAPGLFDNLARLGVRRLLVRDVDGVYRFLYRPAALPGRTFRELVRTKASPARINTTRYFDAVGHRGGIAGLAAGLTDS